MRLMRAVLRLAMLCLSLALLGGALLQDVSGARMTLGMASAAAAMDEGHDDLCPACSPEAEASLVCDLDCTAPVFSTAAEPRTAPFGRRVTPLERPRDRDLSGLDPGSDPFPPRSRFLI